MKLLEKVGVQIDAQMEAAVNNARAAYTNGYVGGYLEELAITKSAGNALTLGTGMLIIQGFRIVVDTPETFTLAALPTSGVTLQYQLVAGVTVADDSRNSSASLRLQLTANLTQDDILGSGTGTYEIELCRVSVTSAGISKIFRTVQKIMARGKDGLNIWMCTKISENSGRYLVRIYEREGHIPKDGDIAIISNVFQPFSGGQFGPIGDVTYVSAGDYYTAYLYNQGKVSGEPAATLYRFTATATFIPQTMNGNDPFKMDITAENGSAVVTFYYQGNQIGRLEGQSVTIYSYETSSDLRLTQYRFLQSGSSSSTPVFGAGIISGLADQIQIECASPYVVVATNMKKGDVSE